MDSLEAGSWLKPAGEVFLGLDTAALIRRVVGVIENVSGLSARQLQGLTWPRFVELFADQNAREGLTTGWIAMVEQRVAPAHWPPYLPFKPGVVARLRPLEDDPDISFVVHLSTAGNYDLLNFLIGTHLLNVMEHTIRVGQHIFRGGDGPLTDLQVKNLGGIIHSAEHTQQLLTDLRTAVLFPATVAPQCQSIDRLLGFSIRDFSHHRITAQQLSLDTRLSSKPVYCHATIRDSVRSIVNTLLSGIEAASTITVSDRLGEDTVQVAIGYRSHEPAFQVSQRIEPVNLSDAKRLETMDTVQRLITTAHACLQPVTGSAWAEPFQGAARIVLVLPRWKGPLPGSNAKGDV